MNTGYTVLKLICERKMRVVKKYSGVFLQYFVSNPLIMKWLLEV
jgi:hypothetical protein